MAISRARLLPKAALALVAAGLLSGCAAYPYDYSYGSYSPGYGYYGGYYPSDYGYGYGNGYGYGGYAYDVAPAIIAGGAFGLGFGGFGGRDFDHDRHHRDFDRDRRAGDWNRGNWHGGGWHGGDWNRGAMNGGGWHGGGGGWHGAAAAPATPNRGFGYGWNANHFSGFHAAPNAVHSGTFSLNGYHR